MSVQPGIATKFPGDTRIDLFPEPDLDRNEYDVEPLAFNFGPTVTLSKLAPNEVPAKSSDALLINVLKVLGPIKSQPTSTTMRIYHTNNPLSQQMLSQLRMYSASYQGDLTPTSDYSCQVVAARLNDRYDLVQRRLTQNRFVENDYFGIIAAEASRGRTLVAFDKNWVLPAVATYIQDNISPEMNRPVELREKMAERNPVENNAGVPYAQWESIGGLTSEDLSLNDLTIYPFQDNAFTTDDGCPSQCYMIFAPVTRDEAEKIYLYLYRDVRLFTDMAYITTKGLSLQLARDFQYLFPVDLKTLGNYVIFSTDRISRNQLEHIYEIGEIAFPFPRLEEFTGAYGSYLLAESLYFQFPIRWENNVLYVGLSGYIQAQDIVENFGDILNDLQRENPFYKELPNYATARNLAQTSDAKCFYYKEKYYAVLYTDENVPTILDKESPDEKPFDETRIEMLMPLLAVTRDPTVDDARKYLKSLGYDVNPNPDPYENKISLGYRTLDLGDRTILTNYYYQSTHGRDLILHQIDGPHQEDIRSRLQILLRKGYFFTQKMLNITRGYPDFIPSDQPINRQLSANPKEVIAELDNLIRGL